MKEMIFFFFLLSVQLLLELLFSCDVFLVNLDAPQFAIVLNILADEIVLDLIGLGGILFFLLYNKNQSNYLGLRRK